MVMEMNNYLYNFLIHNCKIASYFADEVIMEFDTLELITD